MHEVTERVLLFVAGMGLGAILMSLWKGKIVSTRNIAARTQMVFAVVTAGVLLVWVFRFRS